MTLSFFASISILDKWQQSQYTQNALHFSHIAQKLSTVVYQLQKERGLSAGMVGSKNKVYKIELAQQRLQTDQAIKQLAPFFSEIPYCLSDVKADQFLQLNIHFSRLASTRGSIDDLAEDDFFDFYSQLIKDTLNIVSFLQHLSIEPAQKDLASSYLDILWLEEYSGQERGALNGVFSTKEFKANQFSMISSYIASQHASIRHFYNTATLKYQNKISQVLDSFSTHEVKRYREIVFNKAQRNDALNGLQILIGYGGVIHNFKNYVIRGNDQDLRLVKQQFNQASKQIQVYRSLPNLTQSEEKALNDIQATLAEYQNNLSTITDMMQKNASIKAIDTAVQVNDKFALNGIKLLRQSITSHDPELWWKHATHRLDNIHQISGLLADDLISEAQQKLQDTQNVLYLFFIITLSIIFLSCFIGLKLRSRLVNEIKYIADTMRASQKNQQFHQLLSTKGHDEISDMADAFNSLISQRVFAEERLKLAGKVFSNAHEGIIITDIDGNIVEVNPTFCEITEYSRDEVIQKNPNILSSGKHSVAFYSDMWRKLKNQGYWKGEIYNRKKNGQIYPQILTISAIKDDKGVITNYVALFSDITESKDQQKRLEFMAHYDVLTNLPNRTLLADRFIQALAHCKRKQTLLAVCFLDLDNFKPVNDNYGHHVGDKLLIEVAERINSNIRDEDTVSRQGGDEFILLLGEIESVLHCETILKRIILSIAQPYDIDNEMIYISASVGMTLYPTDPSDFDTLMRHADQAMYKAKLAGRNCFYQFNTEENLKTVNRQTRLQEIQQALSENEFCLYYQPKVNMATGCVFGAEALIRWNHPEKGLVPPLDFLPIISGSELEIEIGRWVVNQALKQLEIWKSQGIELEVSVNISSYHLQQPSFVEDLEIALSIHPEIDSRFLQLEILESSALGDLQSISRIIKTCVTTLGVKIALDDFGTGYSSLTHIRNLPVQTIKIDQTFVRDMLEDPGDYAIIEGVIGLADAFNREVIAEGVETVEHGIMLLLMGCQHAQGYGIAKPIPAIAIPDWLSHYMPNQQWISFGGKALTSKETKKSLLKLSLKQWQKHFEHNILASPDDIVHWPILKKSKCHCGVLIKRAIQDHLFEDKYLDQLTAAHETMHMIANNLFLQYQEGQLEAAREGLVDIQIAIKNMITVLGRCE